MDLQITFFNNFFIKNGSHDTIYTFKNYFATVFSVFSFLKISSIETDPQKQGDDEKAALINYYYYMKCWIMHERKRN